MAKALSHALQVNMGFLGKSAYDASKGVPRGFYGARKGLDSVRFQAGISNSGDDVVLTFVYSCIQLSRLSVWATQPHSSFRTHNPILTSL